MTYTLIDSVTLGSSASSVIFSGISGTGKGDLVLRTQVNTGAGVGVNFLKFNGDAVTEVEWVQMNGDGSSATSGAFGGVTYFQGLINSSDTVIHTYQIMDYSATDKQTSGLYRGDGTTGTRASAFRWLSTSAVTSLEIASGTNQFQAGSTFFLYQLVSE